jgi:hypothetical protein
MSLIHVLCRTAHNDRFAVYGKITAVSHPIDNLHNSLLRSVMDRDRWK